MALFGIDRWTERGETFSVYFRMFSTLSFLEVRDGKLGRRKALTGAPQWGDTPGSVGLVMAAIGALMWVGFRSIWQDAEANTREKVAEIGQ